jgi:cytochrome c oxidase subunit 2
MIERSAMAGVLVLLLPALAAAADNPSPAASPPAYFACSSCHGRDGWGSPAIPVPPLAGQQADYLARQLRHYRDGVRGTHPTDTWGGQMALMAANLRDDQIDLLATYLAALPSWPTGATPDLQAPAAYDSCRSCHGESGEGDARIGAPRIRGMDSRYLANQLRHYRTGVRGSHPQDSAGAQMRNALPTGLGDNDIDAIAHYLQQR